MKLLQRLATVLAIVTPLAVTTAPARAGDILETAQTSGNFKTLLAAVKAANLEDVLKSKGPFTLFAPTDAAFEKLPAGMVDTLLKPENRKMLRSLLTYHVLGGKKLMAARIIAARNFDITTVQGTRAEIDTKTGPSIEGARIVQADLAASNGVIHVIDAVIMPRAMKKAARGSGAAAAAKPAAALPLPKLPPPAGPAKPK